MKLKAADIKKNDDQVLKLAFVLLAIRRKHPDIYPEASGIARDLHQSERLLRLKRGREPIPSFESMFAAQGKKMKGPKNKNV